MKIGKYKEGEITTFFDGTLLSIVIETDKINSCVEFSEKTNNYNFIISQPWGYLSDDLQPLNNFSKILSLKINSASTECSMLPKWKDLEFLNLNSCKKVNFDLSDFPNLYHFNFGYTKAITGLSNAVQLKELGIECYGSKDNFSSIEFLSNLKNLEDLGIGNSKIINLNGIESLKKLRCLGLSDNKKLESIKNIGSLHKTLQKIEIENSKKISSYKELSLLKKLNYLRLSDCGIIDSIDFVKTMPELIFFTFMGTTISDTDLSILLDRKFKHIGFNDKKNYSHTMEQISQFLLSCP